MVLRFTRSILILGTLLTLSPGALSQPQCLQLFSAKTYKTRPIPQPQNQKSFEQLLEVMQLLPTDRFELFPRFASRSVYDFLNYVATVHLEQNERVKKIDFSFLPKSFVEEYQKRISHFSRNTAQQIDSLKKTFDIQNIKVEALLNPIQSRDKELQSHVISTIIAPITVMAELLVASQFGSLTSAEKSIPMIVPNWDTHLKHQRHRFSEKDLADLAKKTLDMMSTIAQDTFLIEVKFFGRRKEYKQASGSDVLGKMTLLSQMTNRNPKIRIVLAIVGPGYLSVDSRKEYEAYGVEVVHITPQWK